MVTPFKPPRTLARNAFSIPAIRERIRRQLFHRREIMRQRSCCFSPLVCLSCRCATGFYAESALYQLGGIQDTGRLDLPEDGPVSWTARADLAEAAVAALADTSRFDEITPPLTASEALDFADVARLASKMLKRDVTRIVVTDDEYRTAELSHGFPELMVDLLGSLFRASRAREFDVIDPTLERLLGRKPASMKETLNKFLSRTDAKPR